MNKITVLHCINP